MIVIMMRKYIIIALNSLKGITWTIMNDFSNTYLIIIKQNNCPKL